MTRDRFALWIVLGCAAVGLSLALNPMVALIVAAAVLFAGILQLGPMVLISAAVVAACASRILMLAGVPRLVNYLHFVLVVEGFAAALMQRRSLSPLARQLLRFLAALLSVCILSWALNGGQFAKPLLVWMVLVEPFLAVFAIVHARPAAAATLRFWQLLAGITLVQVPLTIFQDAFLARGNPDLVQGTFVAQGAGAHVVGAIALTGVLFCIAKALASSGIQKSWAIAAGVALGIVPILSDAKQVIACFIPPVVYLLAVLQRRSLVKLVIPTAFIGALMAFAYLAYTPLQKLSDTTTLENGMEGKIAGLDILAKHMNESPTGWLLGVGPGNSISRIAVMTGEAPLQSIGIKTSPVTIDILAVSNHNYLWRSSSAWSSISSWAGIIGDLGPLGLSVYVWGLFLIWRELGSYRSWQTTAAAASLAMAVVLGLMYSWLEEPGFILVIFSGAGLAIAGRAPRAGSYRAVAETAPPARDYATGLRPNRPEFLW